VYFNINKTDQKCSTVCAFGHFFEALILLQNHTLYMITCDRIKKNLVTWIVLFWYFDWFKPPFSLTLIFFIRSHGTLKFQGVICFRVMTSSIVFFKRSYIRKLLRKKIIKLEKINFGINKNKWMNEFIPYFCRSLYSNKNILPNQKITFLWP
jgi:hypothetical protein